MKRCPHCNSTYTNDSLIYCLQDGTILINADLAYAETLINPDISVVQGKTVRGNLLLIAVITGITAALIAYLLITKERFVFSIIFIFTVFIVFLAIFIRSYFKKNKDQNVFYSLITDDLLPNKTRKSLEVKTEIAIIEDKESQSIYENYRKEFKKIAGVNLTHVICDASDKDSQKSSLIAKLKGAEAVVVVRTKELEMKPWVYEALEMWAFQNSHVPCLVIDKINSEELRQLDLNPIPNKFFFIADDKISLPWRLLQRANERAFAWRNQASFNRLTAISVFILLTAGFMIGYFMNSYQKKDYYSLAQKIYGETAKQTKEQVERSFMNGTKDGKLNVSYWFRYNGTLHQLSSTDESSSKRTYTSDKPSVISCGFFAYPNNSVRLMDNQLQVLSFKDEPSSPKNDICKFDADHYRDIKSIICTTYNGSKNPENTVGICVFTEGLGDISNIDVHHFLKDRTKEFYDSMYDSLENKKLIPQ
jgi:hypothetical protein